ncbi:MAG: sortase [Actinomycetota bacterium]|nr:sortase [Actinomycetota bacterium]
MRTIFGIFGLLVIGAGLVLGVFGFMGVNLLAGQIPTDQGASKTEGGFDNAVPDLVENANSSVGGPEDKTLKLTVPKMERLKNAAIPNTSGADETKLKDYAGIHLEGTGFPWQDGANTYIAGHRLGYPSTKSFLAFYDQDKLKKGDKIFVTNSEGDKYTYRVFKSFVVDPSELWVTEPVKGKSILTLQTCTLPDYSERIITRAELVDVSR